MSNIIEATVQPVDPETDYADVAKLLADAFKKNDFIEGLGRTWTQSCTVLGAYHQDELLGTGFAAVYDERQWRIFNLAVRPDSEGMGIGSLLLASLEQTAAHNNMSGTVLDAKGSMQRFYERRGYHKMTPNNTSSTATRFRDERNLTRMRKVLNAEEMAFLGIPQQLVIDNALCEGSLTNLNLGGIRILEIVYHGGSAIKGYALARSSEAGEFVVTLPSELMSTGTEQIVGDLIHSAIERLRGASPLSLPTSRNETSVKNEVGTDGELPDGYLLHMARVLASITGPLRTSRSVGSRR